MNRTPIIKKLLPTVLCTFCLFSMLVSPCGAQKALRDSIRVSEYPPYDTFMPGVIVKFGIQTGFILTKDLDTGMDFGGRISQQFFHPYFKLTSQFHFWAASRKNLDIGVVGIEESITYQIPLLRKLYAYGGFSVGYISMLKEETMPDRNGATIESRRDNNFEPFITVGIEYILDQHRSVFIENKIGSTALSRELHFLIGLNFYLTEKIKDSTASDKQ